MSDSSFNRLRLHDDTHVGYLVRIANLDVIHIHAHAHKPRCLAVVGK